MVYSPLAHQSDTMSPLVISWNWLTVVWIYTLRCLINGRASLLAPNWMIAIGIKCSSRLILRIWCSQPTMSRPYFPWVRMRPQMAVNRPFRSLIWAAQYRIWNHIYAICRIVRQALLAACKILLSTANGSSLRSKATKLIQIWRIYRPVVRAASNAYRIRVIRMAHARICGIHSRALVSGRTSDTPANTVSWIEFFLRGFPIFSTFFISSCADITAATFGHENTTHSAVVVETNDSARRAIRSILDISMFIRTREPTGQVFYLGSDPRKTTLKGASEYWQLINK